MRSLLAAKMKQKELLYEDFKSNCFDLDDNFKEKQFKESVKLASFYNVHINPTRNRIIELELSIYAKQESLKELSGIIANSKTRKSIVHGI